MNTYIALSVYTPAWLEKIFQIKRLCGVAIGDPLCTKRMFEGGMAEQIHMIRQIADHGLEIIYRTPLYITSRNHDEVMAILSMLNDLPVKVSAIVQDIGIANYVANHFHNVSLIWGYLGRSRDPILNDSFFTMMEYSGISGVEAVDFDSVERVMRNGLRPVYAYGYIRYDTLGRQCYQTHQGLPCNRMHCLPGKYQLKAPETDYTMSINGYMLGEKHIYQKKTLFQLKPEKEDKVIVYAKVLKECVVRIQEVYSEVMLKGTVKNGK